MPHWVQPMMTLTGIPPSSTGEPVQPGVGVPGEGNPVSTDSFRVPRYQLRCAEPPSPSPLACPMLLGTGCEAISGLAGMFDGAFDRGHSIVVRRKMVKRKIPRRGRGSQGWA